MRNLGAFWLLPLVLGCSGPDWVTLSVPSVVTLDGSFKARLSNQGLSPVGYSTCDLVATDESRNAFQVTAQRDPISACPLVMNTLPAWQHTEWSVVIPNSMPPGRYHFRIEVALGLTDFFQAESVPVDVRQ